MNNKKKKIRVYLRLSKKMHPLYEEIVNFPPKGVEYLKNTNISHYSAKESFWIKLRNFIWRTYLRIWLPTITLFRNDCDLIHSTNSLSLISNKPWVLDGERGHGVVGFSMWKIKSPLHLFFMKQILRQKNCKKITVFSDLARRDFLRFFGKEFKEKVETVYPAQHISKEKIKKKRGIKILFVARKFELKGGYETLDAFNLIRKKIKCKLIIVSDTPKEVVKKYSNNKDITFIEGNLSKTELLKYYKMADIFLYPSRMEANFGTVLVEAMAHKLPLIANDFYATSEVIENGKNGFIIEPLLRLYDKEGKELDGNYPRYMKKYQDLYEKNKTLKERYLNEIVEKTTSLLKNAKLRKKMGDYGFKLASKGKFSIDERNKKLKRIYEEAIKN
jgi:glycosyltransferase involved in cell wall biosynthesis